MAWEDRLKNAEITTPDGRLYPFLYEDVSRDAKNKTSPYTFSDKKGAFVKNFGVGIVRFPLRMFFNGPNYDLVAKKFDVSTGLPGNCELNHPMYGVITVVIESVRRQDNLQSAGNQAIFEVLMVETIVQDVPLSDGESRSSIFDRIADFVEDAGEVLDEAIYNVTNSDVFNFAKERWNNFLGAYRKTFDTITNKTDELRERFDTTLLGIQGNIDLLLNKPQELASAVSNAFRIPADSPELAQTKNRAYYGLIGDLQNAVLGTTVDSKNQRLEQQTQIVGLLVGVCESNLLASEDGQSFVTRTDAINAAVELLDAYRDAQEFLDNEQVSSEAADLEERFIVSDLNTQNLIDILKSTAGNLINLSFSLKQERIIELQKDRAFVDLCHELYGDTNPETLDFFEKTNAFADQEFILIPKGKEVRYYV